MTQDNENKLKELGWTSVEDEFPPLGEEINVCQADDYTQAIWRQAFSSEQEIKDLKITHWGRVNKKL